MNDNSVMESGGCGAKDARVQVFTAEVRTLTVGSRQVTMSVYSQLDHAAPDDITPFGRVEPRNALDEWVYVAGRHHETGVLVRSSLPYTTWGVRANRKAFEDDLWRLRPDFGSALLTGPPPLVYEYRGEQAELAALRRPIGVVRLLMLNDAAAEFDNAALGAGQGWEGLPGEEAKQRRAAWEARASAIRERFDREFGEMSLIAERWLQLPKIILARLR
jgi:hypothetical protein